MNNKSLGKPLPDTTKHYQITRSCGNSIFEMSEYVCKEDVDHVVDIIQRAVLTAKYLRSVQKIPYLLRSQRQIN